VAWEHSPICHLICCFTFHSFSLFSASFRLLAELRRNWRTPGGGPPITTARCLAYGSCLRKAFLRLRRDWRTGEVDEQSPETGARLVALLRVRWAPEYGLAQGSVPQARLSGLGNPHRPTASQEGGIRVRPRDRCPCGRGTIYRMHSRIYGKLLGCTAYNGGRGSRLAEEHQGASDAIWFANGYFSGEPRDVECYAVGSV
jgi:hypothetical protein